MNFTAQKITFDIARDMEAKKNKEIDRVKFTLEFPDGCENLVVADAIAHQVVKWQQQIRSNWTEFKENGVPEKVEYGQPLFASRRRVVVKPATEEDVNNYISQLNEAGLAELVKSGKMPIKSERPELFKS